MKDNQKEFDESIEQEDDSVIHINIEDGNQKEDSRPDAEDTLPDPEEEPEGAEEASDDPAAQSDDQEDGEAEDQEKEPASGKKKKKKKSARILEAELDKAEAKAADLADRFQRLMAEFENARKRMDKEKGQMFDIGAKSVLEKLLPVVDNFERGLDALSEEEKQEPFAQGIEKIYQQLMAVFDDLGVKPMDAAGKEFNPDLHNAVMHVEDEDLPENVVAEEFQKGYMYKDSVLRHSMVKVAN